MSNLTTELMGPWVVSPGRAVVKSNVYKGDGSATFKAGDLCRITTSGQIKAIGTDTDTTGPVHGMVLTNDFATTAATTSQYVPILEFADDTIIGMQLYAASGSDAEAQDVAIGTSVTLRATAGANTATTTTTKGIALIVDKQENREWFNPYTASAAGDDFGIVFVKFTAANLQARSS